MQAGKQQTLHGWRKLRAFLPRARRALYLLPLGTGVALALPALPARAEPADAIVLVRSLNTLRAGRGSGFIVGDGSWVVTASHVVAADVGKGRRVSDRTALVYTPWTGRPYEARVVALDAAADIALLKLPQGGFPSLPIEGLDLKDAEPARAALQARPLRLFGFPLSYGEDTVASLAKPESNESRLESVLKRGETNLCVLGSCPDAKPGWSGGPIVSGDRGAVVAVFHSLYREKGAKEGVPAGSLSGYLADVLRKAGITDLAPFGRAASPAAPRAPKAAERMALEMRSLSWSAVGNWKKAEEEQRECVRLAPDAAMPHVELCRLLLEQQRFEEALKEGREAVRLDPKSMLANLYLGRALHLNYEPRQAMDALAAAAAVSPGEVEPQLALAEIQEASEKTEQAEKLLRATLESAPDHPAVYYRLGSLLLRAGRADEGFKLLAQASELALNDPELANISLGYARALDTARKSREAEGVYRAVLRADPDNAQARYFFAQFYLRQGRLEDAQLHLSAGILLPRISEEMVQAFRALQVKINERATGM